MAITKISEMTSAVNVNNADYIPIVQGGENYKATIEQIRNAKKITIGTGGDYANVGAAIAAGFAVSAVYDFISDVTETGAIALPLDANAAQTVIILGNGYNWTLGNNAWSTSSSGGATVKCYETNLIHNASSGGVFNLGIKIFTFGGSINMSSSSGGLLTANANQNYHTQTAFTYRNATGGGYDDGATGASSIYVNCSFVGGGSSCTILYPGYVSNCRFSGTFSSTQGIYTVNPFIGNTVNITGSFYSTGRTVGNIITASAGIVFYVTPSVIGNYFASAVTYGTGGAATHNLMFIGNYFASTFAATKPTYASNNVFIGAVTSSDTLTSSNNLYSSTVTNSGTTFHSNDRVTGNANYTGVLVADSTQFSGTLTTSSTVRMSNSGIVGNATTTGMSNINGCNFIANLTISSANISINIQGNIFGGGGAGGGTSTLTLNTGVNRAIITGNQFDNAIVDNSGSGTNIIADNLTY